MQYNITYGGIDWKEYERQLVERQQQHLENVQGTKEGNWQPCMHDQCTDCHGTGIKSNGGICIHGISCPCPKCTPTY